MSFDRTDPIDLAALKSEVETDPTGIGYDQSQTDSGIIDPINLKRATIKLTRPKILSSDVRATCTYDAYNNLSIDEQEWIRWMTASDPADQSAEGNVAVTPDLRLRLADPDGNGNGSIWAVGDRTEMNAAMLALMDVDASRAEQLFGYGTAISRDDWFAARDS